MKIYLVHLELNGAVLAPQLHKFIEKVFRLNFENEYFMRDSEIVRTIRVFGFNIFVTVQIEKI